MKRDTCEFCGLKNVELDREHVCPKWVGDTALLGANDPQLRIARGDKIVHQTTRGISAINITARCACKLKCNNGWMNTLETRVSEFMKPMIHEGAAMPLNDEQQVLLATWCVKTAMVHEFSDPVKNVYFHRYERRHVKSWLQPPDAVWIWLGHSLITSQVYTWPVYLNRGEALTRRPSMYAFTFTAGHFLMQVFAYRRREWQRLQRISINEGPFRDGLIQLWPRRNTTVALWPPPIGISDASIVAFANRFWGGKIIMDGVYRIESPRRPKNRN